MQPIGKLAHHAQCLIRPKGCQRRARSLDREHIYAQNAERALHNAKTYTERCTEVLTFAMLPICPSFERASTSLCNHEGSCKPVWCVMCRPLCNLPDTAREQEAPAHRASFSPPAPRRKSLEGLNAQRRRSIENSMTQVRPHITVSCR